MVLTRAAQGGGAGPDVVSRGANLNRDGPGGAPMPKRATPRATSKAKALPAPAGRFPALQVALDEVNLDRALQYAREAVAGGVDWIEAGTPLIKSVGLDAVRALKREFPGKTIVADMKTMDTGAFETEVAAKAGADVIGILGAASDSTFREAAKAARKYGAKVYMDLISVKDKVARAKEAQALGVDYVCLHMGVDEQMEGAKPRDVLR